MKSNFALTGLMLAVCALAMAQENTPGRIVVPARNGNRTRTVEADLLYGGITVRAGSGGDIVVDVPPSQARRMAAERPKGTEGMRRIDESPFEPVQVQEDGDTVRIAVRMGHSMASGLTVTVPVNTALNIKCLHGSIKVEGVHGDISASDTNGSIELTNVAGTILANTTQGSVKAVLDRLGDKPSSFVTLNGNVDVTLPAETRATFKMKTMHGDIWSDFDVKTTGGPGGVITRGNAGRRTMEFDRTITGTINGGGTEVVLQTFNGRILIHKK